MLIALHILVALVSLWLISGTLLNLSKNPHWYIRGWDFPRSFTLALATALLIGYLVATDELRWYDWAIIVGLVFVIGRQAQLIYPYTPLKRRTVKRSDRPREGATFKLLISNVLQDNDQRERWIEVVRKTDPDVIAAVEVDERWVAALRPLETDYPHQVCRPQDNFYGMVLLSRLPIIEHEVRFLVQDDVPSITARLKLPGGALVRLHAMHPRPPEPVRDQSSGPRDAELILLAREIARSDDDEPIVVCGDLNDVAWSYTTQLFLKISGLLDPRMGRGMYNSYNANSRIFRFPLDHVFHSNEFKLVDLRVCEHLGSDHFPVLIELSLEPQAPKEQPEAQADADDHEEAEEIVEKQAELEADGEEHGNASEAAGRTGR